MATPKKKTARKHKQINTKLLRKIQKHILEEPQRFLMRTFVQTGQGEFHSDVGTEEEYAKCNTAACIGGWAVLLTAKSATVQQVRKKAAQLEEKIMDDEYDIEGRARQRLGLSRAQSDRLFFVGRWPDKFAARYQAIGHGQTYRAQVAVDRIDHFLRTRGRE